MGNASRTPAGVQGCCGFIQGFRSCLAAPWLLSDGPPGRKGICRAIILLLVSGQGVDAQVFEAILVRHDLMSRWLKFQHDFLEA